MHMYRDAAANILALIFWKLFGSSNDYHCTQKPADAIASQHNQATPTSGSGHPTNHATSASIGSEMNEVCVLLRRACAALASVIGKILMTSASIGSLL